MAPWLSHYNSIHPISDQDCNENKLQINRKKSSPFTHFPLYLNCFLYPVQTVALQTAVRHRRTLVCNYLNATFLQWV